MMKNKKRYLVICLPVLLILTYLASGFFTLQSGQHAVILRFGKVVEMVVRPGIHYHFPAPFESIKRAHVSNVQTVSIANDQIKNQERFTGDENLVIVHATISFDIKDLNKYLFISNDVKRFIQATGQMILSRELAKMTVDNAMTSGKSVLRLTSRDQMQKLLDKLKTGVRIISVELTEISPPSQVNSSFKAVSNARVKKQEIIKDAEGYANSTIPRSRGTAASLIHEANAHANELINRAKAHTSVFESLLSEYGRNRKIYKRQKFAETMDYISKKATIRFNSNPAQSTYYLSSQKKKTRVSTPLMNTALEEPEVEVIEME